MNTKVRTISLLGIDGSGKSTLSKSLKEYLEKLNFKVTIVPFHHWLFAHKLKTFFGKSIDRGRKSMDVPYRQKNYFSLSSIFKPIIAFIDNVFFYISKFPKGDNHIIIFDRFICSTQIKFRTLNYNNDWFKKLWTSFKTDKILVFDVPEKISVIRQIKRGDPYLYSLSELKYEREEYISYSKAHSGLIIDTSTNDKESVLQKVIKEIKII